jgi:RNA recognition motif-containing protein
MRATYANPLYVSLKVEDINLVRDKATGKSRGFCFLKYEDARSCVLAVDNLTGSKVRMSSVYRLGERVAYVFSNCVCFPFT